MKKAAIAAVLIGVFFVASGFNTDNAIVPEQQILSGGPPKDGIPAIMKPKFVPAAEAAHLHDSDEVIGVKIGDVARAYPIKILNWHEAVNDTVNGEPVVITF